MKNIVHIVGTGTIGEPLIGLFTDFHHHLGIDQVTFHKRTPMKTERAKVNHLMLRGAHLATDDDKVADFEALGHKVSFVAREALERATVVIDCTPAGNENKELQYRHLEGPTGFLAQGSEFGFGKMYARGINDGALVPGEDRFLQIVSCNTHNLAILVKTIGMEGDRLAMERATFVCMRRANDVSQSSDFVPAPSVGIHDDEEYGTHHARDVFHLYETMKLSPKVFSSAVKLNTQYMHSVWFNFRLPKPIDRKRVLERLKENALVALTDRQDANEVFSFGRDHGYYGRILSQTVISTPTLTVADGGREVVGFCFTPQDGNSLLSSVAGAIWLMDPKNYNDRIQVLKRFVFREI
jgi:glyceraldehyde-3-phosphate dehydrogenase/erythrose-4-phosphate dehydrogenase